MNASNSPRTYANGFYVADSFATNLSEALHGGPFDTPEAAEQERRQINIADDCFILQINGGRIARVDMDTER